MRKKLRVTMELPVNLRKGEPGTAVLLLSLLGAAWLGMGIYCLVLEIKKKKLLKSH